MRGSEPCSSLPYARLSLGHPYLAPKVRGLEGDEVKGWKQGGKGQQVEGCVWGGVRWLPVLSANGTLPKPRVTSGGLSRPVPLWQQYRSSRT